MKLKKFFRVVGITAIVLVILIALGVLFAWSMEWFAPRRQPLDWVQPPVHESPLDEVGDRHDDTRNWIQERLDNHNP